MFKSPMFVFFAIKKKELRGETWNCYAVAELNPESKVILTNVTNKRRARLWVCINAVLVVLRCNFRDTNAETRSIVITVPPWLK